MIWIRKNFVYSALLFLITLFTFWDIFSVFYQQDEWKVLGEYFAMNSSWEIFDRVNFLKAILGEGRILSIIAGFFLLRGFPFEIWSLALYSLIFHFINGLLTFELASRLIGRKFYAFAAAVFFVVCVVSSSTVSWYSTSIGTLPAVTLILLSLLFFYKGIFEKRNNLIIAFILLFLSQLFKEIGYFLFLALPFSVLFFEKQKIRTFIKSYWYYLLTFLVITIYRITQLGTYSAESAVFTQTTSHNFFLTILARLVLYPFTATSLVYIPSEFLLRIAKVFTNHYYPFFPTEHYNLIVESVVLDLLAIAASFLIVIVFILVLKKTNQQQLKNIIFCVLLLVSSYLPYIILNKSYAYLESRYFYLGAAFSGILLGFLLKNIASLSKKIYLNAIIFLLVIVYFIWQIQIVRTDLKELASLSNERRSILSQLSKIKNDLKGQNIFYVIGDRHYYLAHDNYVPFQQGFGYTVLVWLNKDNDQFKQFLKTGVLWDLGSQGYFENESGGFGYFWDKELLVKTLKEKNLSEDIVTSLYYDSKAGLLKKVANDFKIE